MYPYLDNFVDPRLNSASRICNNGFFQGSSSFSEKILGYGRPQKIIYTRAPKFSQRLFINTKHHKTEIAAAPTQLVLSLRL